MQVQNEIFIKDIEIIISNLIKILELRNSVDDLTYATERICSKVDQMEDKRAKNTK